jgi:hypothetical protein
MGFFCKQCKVNWSRLHSQDDGDENYEFCPLCRSDMFLTDGGGENLMWLPIGGHCPLPIGVTGYVNQRELEIQAYMRQHNLTRNEFNVLCYQHEMKLQEEANKESKRRYEYIQNKQAGISQKQDEELEKYFASLKGLQ